MNIDLFPTAVPLAGLQPPEDPIIDGSDLYPLLVGDTHESSRDPLFFFNANVIDGIRGGRWKYYRWVNLYTWPVPLDKPSTVVGRVAHARTHTDPVTGETVDLVGHDPLLFDVRADKDESYDVTGAHGAEAKQLQAAIDTWEREFFANPRGWKCGARHRSVKRIGDVLGVPRAHLVAGPTSQAGRWVVGAGPGGGSGV